MGFVLDESRLLEAIQSTGLPGNIQEEGARLVDFWVGECLPLDQEEETLTVEAGFYLEINPLTFVVGTQDRIFRSRVSGAICGSEWKTTKHRTKYWDAETWFESISQGHQVATYAAGLKFGSFIDPWEGSEVNPRGNDDGSVDILVRAVSKSYPPEIWPGPEGQFVRVGWERMANLLSTYTNEGEAVRARRRTQVLPWQVPGLQCTNQFRKLCPFLSKCREGEVQEGVQGLDTVGQAHSPGSQLVISHLIEVGKINEGNVKDVVVFSSSGLSDLQQCSEKWRRIQMVPEGVQEENEQMRVGTVFHVGVGELYKQMLKRR